MPRIHRQVTLADRTTLGIGGPATHFAEYGDVGELTELWRWAQNHGLPLLPLGQGSNVLVDDAGVDALVVVSRDRRIELDGVRITVGGGADWETVVDFCGARDLHGIECMAGIPGLMGAAPVQNIGAYGQELSDTFVDLVALDTTNGCEVHVPKDECDFRYRTSRFKELRGRFVIVEVTLALVPGGRPTRQYPDLVRRLGEDLAAYPLPDISRAVREIRAGKGMLVRPDDPDSRSAGSFFTNPILEADEVAGFLDRCHARGVPADRVPSWPAGEGRLKVAAAWLIEQSGFSRGDRHGGAAISGKHPLALVNADHATAADVRGLAARIVEGVGEAFGVRLEPEPVFLG